jgi:hypothetical protein
MTGYGDASACLKLRTPVTPTRPHAFTSNGVPAGESENAAEICGGDSPCVLPKRQQSFF